MQLSCLSRFQDVCKLYVFTGDVADLFISRGTWRRILECLSNIRINSGVITFFRVIGHRHGIFGAGKWNW